VYGVGIDRMLEIMEMASDFEILRKYGKTITYKETKYPVDEFRTLLEDNDEFFNQLRQDIMDKINQTELPVEEEVVEEKVETLNLFEDESIV
jgi:recombination protein RecA